MSNFNRLLVTLEMLSQDILEELNSPEIQQNQHISIQYLKLITQYWKTSLKLAESATDLTEKGFSYAITEKGICEHLVNKKMLLIQNRLLEYVVEYYNTSIRIEKLRDVDFSENADKRFDLLTTRAVKYRSQYKVVAKALDPVEYQRLITGIGLAAFDWSWQTVTSP
ncbi:MULTISPECIES: hypothetical protein [Alteromonadaceae]|uniref:hypothetical protein n=1 Tax=Alteromonadaceae TaxID=72275 RepID=UPI001C0893EA|nr:MULTISPECIES: hypothetical protein [Aliiglaciecola]MBU2877658.1 hypothetical protein [Aliiglaciecola lipolytica]MDO6713191.1 hypothetical protein [Aliiglaciecola sp. 2_MG-2023]MDO6754271.1 hypothetical protein [Aliiglaciecola sp. 1_MG-2023]